MRKMVTASNAMKKSVLILVAICAFAVSRAEASWWGNLSSSGSCTTQPCELEVTAGANNNGAPTAVTVLGLTARTLLAPSQLKVVGAFDVPAAALTGGGPASKRTLTITNASLKGFRRLIISVEPPAPGSAIVKFTDFSDSGLFVEAPIIGDASFVLEVCPVPFSDSDRTCPSF